MNSVDLLEISGDLRSKMSGFDLKRLFHDSFNESR